MGRKQLLPIFTITASVEAQGFADLFHIIGGLDGSICILQRILNAFLSNQNKIKLGIQNILETGDLVGIGAKVVYLRASMDA